MGPSFLLTSGVVTSRLGPLSATHRGSIEARYASTQHQPEVGTGQPVLAQRFDVGDGGPHLLFAGPYEIKDAALHSVVLQLRLVHNPLPEWQQDIAIVERAVLCPL